MSSFRIYFEHPWLLLLLLPLALITLWPVMKLPKLRRFTLNRKLSLILHTVILVLLVALLADMTVYRERDKINTIILADLSASAEDSYTAICAYIEEITASAEDKNRIGVVTYAKDALYVSELSKKGEEILEAVLLSEALPEAGATNLEEALYYAEGLLEDDENQRIIVLSDGLQTDGDALAAAEVLEERGVLVDAVCIPTRAVGFEMQVNSLTAPEKLSVGETAILTAVVQSNQNGAAQVEFSDNGEVFYRRIMKLEEGLNELTQEFTPRSFGVHEIAVRVVPNQDDISENNIRHSYLEVGGKGSLLLVDGTGRESESLDSLLSKDYSVTVISPEEATGYMNQLVAYNGVILMNVSNEDLPEGFDKALETYVEVYGGGLLTSGGGNTYAYGGMADTAFEDFLPVTLEQGEDETTAMILMVDTSSSMTGLNHRMAIAGTIQCIETLAETDYVGVLTFDESVNVIYELSSMEYEDEIITAVEQIELERGTYMTDAFQEAFEQLKDFDAPNKHVMILSDGEPQDSGYIRVVRQMAANGISVSAIAVGRDADRRTMQTIAETGGGNYYYASDVNELPDIMVEEVITTIDSYRQNGSFPITVASYSTLLDSLDAESLPKVSGYMMTFLKKKAEQYLTVDGGQPLYVQWKYGAGKVGCFTADLRGSDSEALFKSRDGRQLIKNMVNGVLRADGAVTALEVEMLTGNNTATVKVSAPIKGRETLQVTALSPDGSEQAVNTVLTTDGTYQGSLDISQPGVYTITVTHLDSGGKLLDYTQSHLASSYSVEYNAFVTENGEELLAQVCALTGGKMSYTASGILDFTGKLMEQAVDPTVVLLVVILLLFLADVAVRKIRFKKS